MKSQKNGSNGANLGFEQKLWLAADKLRSKIVALKIVKLVDETIDKRLVKLGD